MKYIMLIGKYVSVEQQDADGNVTGGGLGGLICGITIEPNSVTLLTDYGYDWSITEESEIGLRIDVYLDEETAFKIPPSVR
jgi:hypothetical protein